MKTRQIKKDNGMGNRSSAKASKGVSGRWPSADYNDICFYLGLIDPPRSEGLAQRAGVKLVGHWARSPITFEHVARQQSALESALRALPPDSKQFILAENLVRGMLLDVPVEMVNNKQFYRVVYKMRSCLIRTTEKHLEVVCNCLGVEVPKSNRAAKRLAAHVVKTISLPHAQHMTHKDEALYDSLSALPKGSREHKLAKILVYRATSRRRVPWKIKRSSQYRKIAKTLRQGLSAS